MTLESTTFGSTNRSITRLGFGGAPTGHFNYLTEYSPEKADQREKSIAAIQHAADSGINYFDTAAAYGKGEGERIYGEALAGRVNAPSDMLHAEENDPSTGSGWQPSEGESANGSSPVYLPSTVDGPEDQSGLFLATKVAPSEPDVRGSIERSLRNLRVDRIDLVQVHGGSYTDEDEDRVMRPGGMLETFEKARDEGLIRHIGFTTEDQNGAVYRFIESGRFEVMQVQYNLLYQHPYSLDRPFGCMFAAHGRRMGIVTMRSLTGDIFQRWMKLVRPDDHFDYSTALLQFTLSNPFINVALAGMRTPDEVDRNIAVLNDTSGRVDLDELHRKFV